MIKSKWQRMLSNHSHMFEMVYPCPGGDHPWSGSNNLGNVVGFEPGALNRQSVLKLDEWGPPEMWTISLGIDNPGDWSAFNAGVPARNYNAEPVAVIDVGAGGSTQTIVVDWLNGTQISVPMNAVNVTCTWERSIGSTSDIVAPPGLRISAQVGRGNKNNGKMPTRTIATGNLNSVAGNLGYIIPPFTREIEVVFPVSSSSPVVATTGIYLGGFFDGTSLVQLTQTIAAAGISNGMKIPVARGSRYIVIADAAAAPNRTTPFYLISHLGI